MDKLMFLKRKGKKKNLQFERRNVPNTIKEKH